MTAHKSVPAWRVPVVMLGLLLAALAITGALIANRPKPEQKATVTPPLLVEVMPLAATVASYRVEAQGTVTPKVSTTLVSEVQGRVVEVAPAFVSGGLVKSGELLVRVEPDDYQIALRAREAELAKARAALEEEKARGQVAALDWQKFKAEQVPELGLRKPQLAQEMANVKYAEAALDKAKRDLARTEIRAPYDALVSAKQVDLGQFVTVGSSLGTLFGTDVAEIRLPLTDNQLATLEQPFLSGEGGEPPAISISAEIGGQRQQWPARLVRSEGVIDSASRFIYVVAEVDDPYQRLNPGRLPLKFGRFVEAVIHGAEYSGIYVLPRGTVHEGNRVVLVDDDNRIQLREVKVAAADASHAYINGGLSDGERLVVTAIANPLPGTLVAVQPVATGAAAEVVAESGQ